ncbi:head decoration protein [Iodobacter arcticus]|uniref:Head decoration protein n=1 Tax=Iodobacter arcticus TaxID=590593 RepID=A0ABW2R2P5_9NEIS
MSAIMESLNLGDWLKYEAPNLYSREVATVAAAQNLPAATVVARLTASAQLVALNPTASNGAEVAVGVLAHAVNATLALEDDALLIARHAIVASTVIVWPATITAPQKAIAIAQLEQRGILIRAAA